MSGRLMASLEMALERELRSELEEFPVKVRLEATLEVKSRGFTASLA